MPEKCSAAIRRSAVAGTIRASGAPVHQPFMRGKPKKGQRQKNLTDDFLSGSVDEDRLHATQRFNRRSKHHQANKTARTALQRLAESEHRGDVGALPLGRVIQVHSLHIEVRAGDTTTLCVVRRTTAQVAETRVVVGDLVRFRDVTTEATPPPPDTGRPPPAAERQGVSERIEPRRTVLTRVDSFDEHRQAPIVANADQMLIVVSLLLPRVKWGLIDRMLIAARAGGLRPIVCLNKWDLRLGQDARLRPGEAESAAQEADAALAHLSGPLGVQVLRSSVQTGQGIDTLRALTAGCVTVLTGHSGVGKSSLASSIQPGLNLRVAEVSNYNQKGRHTTTSARWYDLSTGGAIIDTPGVRRFGLWNVTPETLIDHFPDVAAGAAPAWRLESYQRIRSSLG